VNDLPLDTYCRELAADIDLLVSKPRQDLASEILAGNEWDGLSVEDIRSSLRRRAVPHGRDVEKPAGGVEFV
jgi:hypothetical protein